MFKTPSWYLTQTLKKGRKKNLLFFILLKRDTDDAHMQNFIQIPQNMKTGFPNVTKLVKLTLLFHKNSSNIKKNPKKFEV